MGGLSIASLYGQHIEDGLNFSCIAFMDGNGTVGYVLRLACIFFFMK